MSDDEFLEAFQNCTLPRALWTHEAHLRMAWLYLRQMPFDEALERVRTGIQRYNLSLGNTTGYHETRTTAFVQIISARIQGSESFEQFRQRHPELWEKNSAALARHYSCERLNSEQARSEFLAPDRKPFDRLPEKGNV